MLVQSKRAFKFDQNYILCWYSSLAYSITTDEKFIAKYTDGIESHIFVHFLSGTKMRLTLTGRDEFELEFSDSSEPEL